MKKILSVLLSLCVVACSLVFTPAEAAAATEQSGIFDLLSELGIMTGDPDGNLRPDDYVTRAEFTKLAIAASSFKNSVAANLSISPFPDVTYKHWAAPYVRVGITGGIVSGYPDATFKPDETVKYEEAITMMLRVLGYTDDDFGVSWPSGQIGLANNLDLTDNINCVTGELMKRSDVAVLVYNTLNTKLKNQQNKLISIFDASIYEDVTIVASSREDSSIASDEIFTSNGTYKTDKPISGDLVGSKGDIAVKNDGKFIAFVASGSDRGTEEYVVYSVLDNKVMAYKNNSIGQIEIDDDVTAYKGKNKMTFAALKPQLELGDKLKVRISVNGEVDYVTYGKGDVQGPVTSLGGNWKTAWNIGNSVSFIRNGNSVSEKDIQNYDIVYYLPDLNTILAYDSKVTGIYEKAVPNRDIPNSVVVSGKEHSLEGSASFNKLYSGGTYEYGDTVTLLLGRNGKVADVISPSATIDGVAGYLAATGIKEYSSGELNTYRNYYINIIQTDGVSYEYITDKDYSENLNSVVTLNFKDGYARISNVNGSYSIGGAFDWRNKKIGTTKLSSSVEILDIGTRDNTKAPAYAKLYGQRLDGVNIASKSVIYAEKNSAGEVIRLILDNVTNDSFAYGFVTSVRKSTNRAEYDYIVDGNRYTTSKISSVKTGDVAMIHGSVQNPSSMIAINAVKEPVSSITDDRIIAGNVTHKLSDNLVIYKRATSISSEYSMIELSELINNKNKYTLSVYYDKTAAAGGRVRVIIATEKEK